MAAMQTHPYHPILGCSRRNVEWTEKLLRITEGLPEIMHALTRPLSSVSTLLMTLKLLGIRTMSTLALVLSHPKPSTVGKAIL